MFYRINNTLADLLKKKKKKVYVFSFLPGVMFFTKLRRTGPLFRSKLLNVKSI